MNRVSQTAELSPELLALLACPVADCHAPLIARDGRLVCSRCGLRYVVGDRWINLIPEEAEPPEGR